MYQYFNNQFPKENLGTFAQSRVYFLFPKCELTKTNILGNCFDDTSQNHFWNVYYCAQSTFQVWQDYAIFYKKNTILFYLFSIGCTVNKCRGNYKICHCYRAHITLLVNTAPAPACSSTFITGQALHTISGGAIQSVKTLQVVSH